MNRRSFMTLLGAAVGLLHGSFRRPSGRLITFEEAKVRGWLPARVLLNGRDELHVRTLFTGQNEWVDRFVTDEAGHIKINEEHDDVLMERVYGHVVYLPNEIAPSTTRGGVAVRALLLFLAICLAPLPAVAQAVLGGSLTEISTSCSTGIVLEQNQNGLRTAGHLAVNFQAVPSLGVWVDVGTSATIIFERSGDGVTWTPISDVNGAAQTTIDGFFSFTNLGYSRLCIRASAISGTTVVMVSRGGAALAQVTCTPAKLISAASTNATLVRAGTTRVAYVMASNTNAAVRFLKLYNKATAPTVGTDVPVHTLALEGSAVGRSTILPVGHLELPLGFGFATTTGAADTDAIAVAAGEIIINYCYR